MNKKEERRIWKIVKKLKKKGLLISQTNEDIKNEPTALSNSEYRLNTNKKDE
jgi:biotin operon repressor